MALPEQLADFEQRLATRFADAVAQVRRELSRRVERATSDLSTELAAYSPPSPPELLSAAELAALGGPSRDAVRREFAEALLAALVAIDRASSQRGVLEALLAASRDFADRAALWLTRDREMLGWGGEGFEGDAITGLAFAYDTLPCLTRLAGGTGVVQIEGAEAARLASEFEIAAPRTAAFIPLVLRDRIAAALYVDRVSADELEVAALQLLVYAAAQRIELQGLSSREATPTLLAAEAGAVAGLPLWTPPTLPPEPAPEETGAAEPALLEPETPTMFSPPAVAVEAAEPESETLADAMPTMSTVALSPAVEEEAPPPSVEPTPSEISWQTEEAAEETVFLGTVPVVDEPPVPATPAAEVEVEAAPPAVPEEATAPHRLPWYAAPPPEAPPSPAATHEVALPPSLATTAIPVFEPDLSEDATVLVRRPEFVDTPAAPVEAPPLYAPPPSEPVEDQTHPSLSGPGIPAEERAAPRGGARTTEVAPPPDLQGPGWAFTTARLPRAGGENALHEEARRLARLLVSEIKLYNEEQVEEGRRNRDVYHRLKDDIDRSRQIYEERIHESVRESTDYFQQELVRSLAGGDPRALGI